GARAPAWANDLATGPLFPEPSSSPPERDRLLAADQLLARLSRCDRVSIHWSLSDRDFPPEGAPRLVRIVDVALRSPSFTFLFDRRAKPTGVAAGLDRGCPAVLPRVALALPTPLSDSR